MPLDLEVYRQGAPTVGSAISRREGVIFSLVAHAGLVALWILAPSWAGPETASAVVPTEPQQQVRYVTVTPSVEVPAVAKPNVVHSDRDRRAASPDAAPVPANEQPRSVGDTTEKIVGGPPVEKPAGSDTPPVTPPAPTTATEIPSRTGTEAAPAQARASGPGLGASLRNLQQYLEKQNFNNPQGGQAIAGDGIQFDSKGVEFGPWIRRFLAQVKRNWLMPQAAMTQRGRVSIQFYVHKDGRITDINVVKPSPIASFNGAALAALRMSNPTLPLPPEYPDDKVLFTVTFLYNEEPGR